jgi:hypothetical protein
MQALATADGDGWIGVGSVSGVAARSVDDGIASCEIVTTTTKAANSCLRMSSNG